MAIATTANESVLPALPVPPRRGRWHVYAVVGAVAAFVGTFVAGQIHLPYFAIGPGSVVGTGALVEVADGPSFPADGLAFPTVSLGKTTLLEALEGWLDPTVDVVEEEVIVPPQLDPDDLHEFNVELMSSSKEKAMAVAFTRLGFEVLRGGEGAVIGAVLRDMPAAAVLRPGDVVVGVDGAPIETDADLFASLDGRRPGEQVAISYRLGDDERDHTFTLVEHPEEPGRALLGVTGIATANPVYDFPYDVEITSQDIGGPSAGLAWTLQVLDELTEGQLTGDLRVAATGEIELDGTVAEVGGVPQKAVAVSDADIDVFLVPASEADEARKYADDDVRIEPVTSLDDALAALARLGGDPLEPT